MHVLRSRNVGCETVPFVCGGTLYTVKSQSIISGTENNKSRKPTVTVEASDASETNDSKKQTENFTKIISKK